MSTTDVSKVKTDYSYVNDLGEGYKFIRVQSPKKDPTNNLNGYSIEISHKVDCTTKRYVLSLAATFGSLGLALLFSPIREAVFNKKSLERKIIPLTLNGSDKKIVSEQSHFVINSLWQQNVSDPNLNKLKLLVLHHDNVNDLAHKLAESLDEKESLTNITYYEEIKTHEDLKAFKHYLIASHPKLSNKDKKTLVDQLKSRSPLFLGKSDTFKLEKYITDFSSRKSVKFAKNLEIKIVDKNQGISPKQDKSLTSKVNFNDRFMSSEEFRTKELLYRGPTESTVRQTVDNFLKNKKPLQVVYGKKTNFAQLDQKENISYDQLFSASTNKLIELSIANNVFLSYQRYLSEHIAYEMIDLLHNDKSIASTSGLKDAVLERLLEINEHQYQLTVEEFGLLIKKKDRLFIYNDVFFSPDGNNVVKEYKEIIEQYEKDLKAFEVDPTLEKPHLEWKEGEKKSIKLITLEAPLLEKAKIVIDAFFDDPQVISRLDKMIAA